MSLLPALQIQKLKVYTLHNCIRANYVRGELILLENIFFFKKIVIYSIKGRTATTRETVTRNKSRHVEKKDKQKLIRENPKIKGAY